MTDIQYPVYEPGQTLTADELNMTAGFLMERDRILGRLIGFGVNCGLGGAVDTTGSTLTIATGLAIDQSGTALLLPAGFAVTLPPTAVTPSYDFIDATSDGFSVVLEALDDVSDPPPCGQADCGGHPKLHTVDATVRVVAGRITGTWMDFDTDKLLTVDPMRLSLDSDPQGSYVTLRNAIAARLTNGGQPLVDPALITKLQGTSIGTTDLPGVKGYKCGWINMVLFAALDLLRCEALHELSCDRTTTRNGVVLGWVHQVGTGWVFDCSYRHAWEPPLGFTDAFLGGTCSDPCALYRDALEGLLAGYAPPDPPPAGGGGRPVVEKCPHGHLVNGKCDVIYYPPVKIPDGWQLHWKLTIPDRKGPVWNPPIWITPQTVGPDVVYEIDGFDHNEDGYLHAGGLLGHPAGAVQDVLTSTVQEGHGQATILVKTADELPGLNGYAPSEGFSPSDIIVLTVAADADSTVIATGRIPALQTAREMAAALPAAVAAAGEATAAAAGIKETVTTFAAQVVEVNAGMKGLGEQFTTLSGKVDATVTLAERVSRAEGSISVLSGRAGGGLRQTFDAGFARGISDFAQTTVQAMRSLGPVGNKNFQRHTAAAERARAELDLAVTAGDPGRLTVAALGVLSTMRTMVKAAGADATAARQLDTQLRGLQGMIV